MISCWCLIVTHGLSWLLYEISLPNLSGLYIDLSSSLKSNVTAPMDSPYMFPINVCLTAPLRDISFQNVSDLDIDFSRKLRSNVILLTTGLPTYGFLLMFNNNIWPILVHLRHLRFHNMSDLDFTFQCHSRSNVMVSLDSPYMLSYL